MRHDALGKTGTLFVVLAILTPGSVRAQPAPGWLDARDCGASGSKFQTQAATVAGSKQITVKDVGDLKAGQGVMVSKSNARYTNCSLWGPRKKYAASQPLKDVVEMRGYDGTAGSWVVYVLDIDPAKPTEFRWTDDLGRTWQPAVPMTYDWQPLSGGTEVRFRKFDWQDGYTVVLVGRDQLVTTIEKVEGNVLTLKDPANRTVADAVVRHNDTVALQAAVDRAIKEKQNVFVPVGNYRLSGPIVVNQATAIAIEGQNAVDTVLDMSEGAGACFLLRGGTEVTIRNFSMLGHMGFDESDRAGVLRTLGGTAVWGFYFKSCSALQIEATERVLVENCHARRMSTECFYSAGPSRWGTREPKAYTKAITYSRCSVVDCARNGFNNNDFAENTSILHCRIVDVGGCSWEGASRFVRFIGNYVRNSGTVAMGNIGSRDATLEELGSGQHIVADNVFEGRTSYAGRPGGFIVRATCGATQVIVRNNIFVNYNSSAIEIVPGGDQRHLPTRNCTVTGNIIDLTAVGEPSLARTGIHIGSSDAIVSDNQIYTRGSYDVNVTAIRLTEPAINLVVHDNLLRNCGLGIASAAATSVVGEIVDPKTFLASHGGVPLERRQSHCYRGWNLALFRSNKPAGSSVIEAFDPETLRFQLKEPREMKAGDGFQVFPPSANWHVHDNTITGCLKPVGLDSNGSEASVFRNNLVSRGEAVDALSAIEAHGRFQLIGNHVSGFDEQRSTALALTGEPLWPGPAPIGDGTSEAANAPISVYLPSPAKAPGAAIVICPGGGYMRHVLDREGPRIARWLNEHGIAGIVLEYRLPQGRPRVPLLDAQRAVRTVRSKAAQWNIDPNRIGILGFSAGGHLASAAGTHFDGGDPKAADPIDRVSCRPDFMVLIYPVITMGEKTHAGSKTNLLGDKPKPELVELFSNEKQVTDKTPPAFLAHAKDDVGVPPENSRMFSAALKAHNVAAEYLELPSGGHGFDGCKGPMWEAWKTKSLEWLAAQGIIPGSVP
jgi:acetyl esterase/lipase